MQKGKWILIRIRIRRIDPFSFDSGLRLLLHCAGFFVSWCIWDASKSNWRKTIGLSLRKLKRINSGIRRITVSAEAIFCMKRVEVTAIVCGHKITRHVWICEQLYGDNCGSFTKDSPNQVAEYLWSASYSSEIMWSFNGCNTSSVAKYLGAFWIRFVKYVSFFMFLIRMGRICEIQNYKGPTVYGNR